MGENKSTISKANSDENIGEFWDNHDFTEFDGVAPDVDFEVISTLPVHLELLHGIEVQLAKRELKVETLVNRWLRQKLDEEAA